MVAEVLEYCLYQYVCFSRIREFQGSRVFMRYGLILHGFARLLLAGFVIPSRIVLMIWNDVADAATETLFL